MASLQIEAAKPRVQREEAPQSDGEAWHAGAVPRWTTHERSPWPPHRGRGAARADEVAISCLNSAGDLGLPRPGIGARVRRSSLAPMRPSPRHHGIGDESHVNVEQQYTLDASSCTRLRAILASAYDSKLPAKQGYLCCDGLLREEKEDKCIAARREFLLLTLLWC